MDKVRGMGGFWVTDTVGFNPDQSVSHTLTIVHNAEYEVETSVDVRQTRSIGCGGWTEGLPRFRKLEMATFKVAEDDVSYPQVLGFTEGSELSVYLKRGELFQFDYIERTLVRSVRVMNPQDRARRVEIVCIHGVYRRNWPLPDGFPLPQTSPSPFRTPAPSTVAQPLVPDLPEWLQDDDDQGGAG